MNYPSRYKNGDTFKNNRCQTLFNIQLDDKGKHKREKRKEKREKRKEEFFMTYACHDTFMIRTPALPFNVAENLYTRDESEVWDYIKERGLDEYMLESLFISSPSLYNAILKIGQDKKKDQATFVSLYKYLVRASSRTTPLGLMANVALGNFSSDENVYIEKLSSVNKHILISYSWIYKLVEELQKDQNVLDKVSVVWNKSTYATSSRIRNPHFANHGVNELNEHKNASIRFTKLIQIIKDNTKSFKRYSELVDLIESYYEGVPREKIIGTINVLIEKEYLLTELRIPTYCENPAAHVLSVLEKNNLNEDLQSKLREIISEIKTYEDANGGIRSLKKITNIMKEIHKDKLYLDVNTGMNLKGDTLPISVKDKLEKFVEVMEKIGVDSSSFSSLKEFKSKFQEEYGTGVEVPLIQIIDPAGFNGLSYYTENQYNSSDRDTKIKNIIDNKVQEALFNREKSVHLYKEDFQNVVLEDDINFAKSFDINMMIYKDKEIKLKMGANFGASVAGKSFQRFAEVFEKNKFEKYNKVYEYAESDDYLYVDLMEMSTKGRFTSLLNSRRNYPYTLALSMPFDDNAEYILLDDLVCGMTENNRMYLKSTSKNKLCKMITDNMLNPQLNSKLFNLIKDISNDENELEVVNRLAILSSNKYAYTPEIFIEDIKISSERWLFREDLSDEIKYKDFIKSFEQFSKRYSLPEYFYMCKSDNLLLLRAGKDITMEILYKEYKKTRALELCAMDADLFNNQMAKNIDGDSYALECIFSFYNAEKKDGNNDKSEQITMKENIGIQNENRILAPFEDGWVYMKIYTPEEMENDFLTMLESKKAELFIDKFFFIRYSDETGRHIRLRIKYKNSKEAFEKFSYVKDWLSELRKIDILRIYTINEYHRENNRYGGADVIESIENIFFENSEFVIRAINNNDMTDSEIVKKVYFSAVSYFLGQLVQDKNEMYELLDKVTNKNHYRKEYKSKRKEYMKTLDGILESIQRSEVVDATVSELTRKANLTSSIYDIKLSLLHMCCNRLNGARELESYTYGILRHTLYDSIQRDKKLKIINSEQNK